MYRKASLLLCRQSTTFFNEFKFLNAETTLGYNVLRNITTSWILSKNVAFNLSDIGEGIREVVVKEWFVKPGDKVSQFDNICEVQSDKASVTITSRYDGIVKKLYYKIDDTALVGKPLVEIETEEAENVVSESVISNEITNEVADDNSLSAQDPTGPICIPSVRRLAKEHNLDLSKIIGTGKRGKITKEDVIKYMDKSSLSEKFIGDSVEPIKGIRKAMVKTMTESLKIPQLGYSDEIIVTRLSKLRKELKDVPELKDIKLTFLPFVIKAISNSLEKYPILNSSIDEKCENIIYHSDHNIGIAMDTKDGLAVPVVKNVQNLSIIEIATELNRLMQTGKNGIFSPSDLSGGTFSVSNIGSIGGTYVNPVVLPPQVAILALGKIQVMPKFDNNRNVVAEEIINMSGSADHRIIDGATMANFTAQIKKQLENPSLLFLNL